tara:strand:- start:2 stop:334 length:333 start_codon:yes stop_codon:yes gene_type:complete
MHHEAYLESHARSLLRPLEVRGRGQQTESLASFVARLAWHHSVKPSVLVGGLLDLGKSPGFLKFEIATCFNSLSPKTIQTVQKVSESTGLDKNSVASAYSGERDRSFRGS